MAEVKKKKELLSLYTNLTSRTKIVEPMKKIHGTLRDRDAIEREIALIMRDVLESGYFKTRLTPRQLAKLVCAYYDGKNDTEIAREMGDEKLSKTVARARVRLKLTRDFDYKMPFERSEMEELLESGKTMREISVALGVSPSTLREYRHIIEQEGASPLDPFLERIMDVMEDRDLTEHMTRSVTNDGLSEAIDITESELIDIS